MSVFWNRPQMQTDESTSLGIYHYNLPSIFSQLLLRSRKMLAVNTQQCGVEFYIYYCEEKEEDHSFYILYVHHKKLQN